MAARPNLLPVEQATRALATKRRRTRHRWAGAMALLAVLLGWFVGRPVLLGPVVIGIPVIRADLVQTLVASGHVETPFRVSIGTQITGVVTGIPVKEGQRVKAGDTLLLLDATETRALSVQAEGQVAQAAARMRQIREVALPSAEQAVTEAKATLLNAQQAFDRNRNLTDAGFESEAARDEAQRSLDVAKVQLRTAELQLSTNRTGGSDYTLAASQLAQAQANLSATRSRTGYRTVTAPRDGLLISRSVEVGDVVQPGKELMLLSPAGDANLVVQVDEKNLGLIAIGQQAIASADAYATQRFHAVVSYINPGVDLTRASVEVKLTVPTPPAYLRQDMTISVDIEAGRHAGVLIVPSADIHDLGGAHPWVLVARGSHATRQEVVVGVTSAGKAEILTGVKEGEMLVPSSSGSVADGKRIRLQTASL
jgi:HlyD family secretion protein